MESGSLVMAVNVVVGLLVLRASWISTSGGEETGSAREVVNVAKFFEDTVIARAAGGAAGGSVGGCSSG